MDGSINYTYFEKSYSTALESAYTLLTLLKSAQLNVCTAESLTAGNIAKILVDIPYFGAYIYGGFVVYDTDAKRVMIDVKTPNVYNALTASQMAEGVLDNSRAMVAIAVTGNAGPVDLTVDEDMLGDVYVGISIRAEPTNPGGSNKYYTKVCKVEFCRKNTPDEAAQDDCIADKYGLNFEYRDSNCDYATTLCNSWIDNYRMMKKQNVNSLAGTSYALSLMRNVIRNLTASFAYNFAEDVIKDYLSAPTKFIAIKRTKDDCNYANCGEPSSIINKYLDSPCTNVKWPTTSFPSLACPPSLNYTDTCNLAKGSKEPYKYMVTSNTITGNISSKQLALIIILVILVIGTIVGLTWNI